VLLRLAYLGVTNALAMLRLLPMSNQAKDAEILALRHQITVLQRQLHGEKVRFDPSDRAFLAALLHRLPRDMLRRVRLLVRPDTVLRWHRDLVAHRHAVASRPKRAGPPRTVRSIRMLVLRLARENSSWGTGASTVNYSCSGSSRVHGLGDPPRGGGRPSPAADLGKLGYVPALPGRGDPGG
jgi:putative transposase